MEPIEMEKVKSRNINSIGYSVEHSELHVRFHKSGVYVYHDVPWSVYEGIATAPSKGRYLDKHIKGIYSFSKPVPIDEPF